MRRYVGRSSSNPAVAPTDRKQANVHTSLRIDGANCPTCFNQTLDDLAGLPGVRLVQGSFAGPCIDVIHDVPLEAITAVVRNRLRGIEMFANEVRMVPLEPSAEPGACVHHAATPVAPAGRVDPAMTLGEIVTQRPGLAATLERIGLDYCCHGGRTLAEAAEAAGLDTQAVAEQLAQADPGEPVQDWASLDPVALAEHIVHVHHRYLWEQLPRIGALLDKIVGVHGARHPELSEVQGLFNALRADLVPHLVSEEQDVFPLIGAHLTGADDRSAVALAAQLDALGDDHETVGELLERLREVTHGYVAPADGCATYTACFRALEELEADTHLHVHKENNVLIPAVRAALAPLTSAGRPVPA